MEAFLVKINDETMINGQAESYDDLKISQKVKVEIIGKYTKELVSLRTLFKNQEELPVYVAEKIKVIPYTKQEILKEMTVEKGEYGLYI